MKKRLSIFLSLVALLLVLGGIQRQFIAQEQSSLSPPSSPQTTGNPASGTPVPRSETSIPQGTPQGQSPPSPALSQSAFPTPSASGQYVQTTNVNSPDPSIKEHMQLSGGREDIVQIGDIQVSESQIYTGDDVVFTVTIENNAPYKKFVRWFCFNSDQGNFGCQSGFNLNAGQVFTISNSGRFTTSGIHRVWVSWSQDGAYYISPVNGASSSVRIL